MSTALAKKMNAGGGVAPTLLRSKRFWTDIQRSVGEWALEHLGVAGAARVVERRIVAAGEEGDGFEHAIVYRLSEAAHGGLRGVVANRGAVLANASKRLGGRSDAIDGAPELFLRLVFETAAAALCQAACGLSADVGARSDAFTFRGAEAFEAGPGEGSSLLIGVKLVEADEDVRVGLVYDASAIAEGLRRRQLRAAISMAQGGILSDSVKSAIVPLEAVLDQITMPIGACARLKPGDVLDLPEADPDQLDIKARTIDASASVGAASLGVLRGSRAVKFRGPPSESFVAVVADQ